MSDSSHRTPPSGHTEELEVLYRPSLSQMAIQSVDTLCGGGGGQRRKASGGKNAAIDEEPNEEPEEREVVPDNDVSDTDGWNDQPPLLLGRRGAEETTLLLKTVRIPKQVSTCPFLGYDFLSFPPLRLSLTLHLFSDTCRCFPPPILGPFPCLMDLACEKTQQYRCSERASLRHCGVQCGCPTSSKPPTPTKIRNTGTRTGPWPKSGRWMGRTNPSCSALLNSNLGVVVRLPSRPWVEDPPLRLLRPQPPGMLSQPRPLDGWAAATTTVPWKPSSGRTFHVRRPWDDSH